MNLTQSEMDGLNLAARSWAPVKILAGSSRAERLAACRHYQAHYQAQDWPASRSYRMLNAGFYLQLKRGIARTAK